MDGVNGKQDESRVRTKNVRRAWQFSSQTSAERYQCLEEATESSSSNVIETDGQLKNGRHQRSSSVPNVLCIERKMRPSKRRVPNLRTTERTMSEEPSRCSEMNRSSTNHELSIANGNAADRAAASAEELMPPPPYSSMDSRLDILPPSPVGARAGHVISADHGRPLTYSDPPPSYCELFSNTMRTTVRQLSVASARSGLSNSRGWKTLIMLSCLSFPVIGFAFALPISMIATGIAHIDDCPAQPRIPVFLIVGGVIQMLECLYRMASWLHDRERRHDNDNNNNNRKMKIWDPCLYIGIICFILSSVYIYKTNPVYHDVRGVARTGHTGSTNQNSQIAISVDAPGSSSKDSRLYCDETTFKLAFWVVTIYYVMIGTAFGGMVLAILGGAYFVFRDQRRSSEISQRAQDTTDEDLMPV